MASSEFEIKVTGANQLKRRLVSQGFLLLPLRQYFNSTGLAITARAREIAPKDLGTLRNSITFKPVRAKGRMPRGIKIMATAPYAIYVHGDPNKKYRQSPPFNRTKPHYPPVSALTGWAERKGLNPYAVAASIAEKGTPIIPFLKMAYNDTRAERKILLSIATRSIESNWKAGRKAGI